LRNSYFMKPFITISFIFLFFNALAQKKNLDVYNLNFEELSKLKIVTASKTEQDIKELTSTLHVISAEEIQERAYFTLDEMLSDLPGFQFRNVMSLNSYVFQRGIPNQNNLTLILIDGIQVNELNSGGFYGGGQYNLSNIERVEVVYGPSSVAYGTNAVSGIINIITKNAEKNKGSFTTTIGNFNNWTDLLDNFEDDYALDMKVNYKNFIFGTNYLNKQTSTATFQKSIGSSYKDYGTLWNIRFLNNYLKYNHRKHSLNSVY
jgi:outer membrane receptor for ferrienterochelin and colicin